MRALSMFIVIAGVAGPLWIASALLPGQALPDFLIGFAGCTLALLIASRLPKDQDLPGPYVPIEQRIVATVGHYYGGAAVAAGLALLIVWLLVQAVPLQPGYLAWGFACAGIMAGLGTFVALSARKWAGQSEAAARNAWWPGA